MATDEMIREVARIDKELLSDPLYLEQISAGMPIECCEFDPVGGLILPDNVVSNCTLCNRLIQTRPFNDVAKNKYCTHCARNLAEIPANA